MYNLSLDVPLITPVIARETFYWTLSTGGGTRWIENALNFGIFYDIQTSGIQENIQHVQDQTPSIKVTYRWRRCILIAACMHMHYIFPIEKENLFSSSHFTHFILPSKFWISIQHDRNHLILDNYESEVIRISFSVFSCFTKGSSLVFNGSNLFQK